MPESVFANQHRKFWPYVYEGTIVVDHLVGGVPSDDRAVAGWIKKNLGWDNERSIQEAVTQVMADRQVPLAEAADIVASTKSLAGFKRDQDSGELYIEGRQLKACVKEATSIAVAAGALSRRGWGETNKGSKSFVAEHLMVIEDRLPLGVKEPTGIQQRFVHNGRTEAAIQYEEYVEEATFDFTVETNYRFTDSYWAAMWVTAQQEGIGATRSQGFGRFTVTRWEQIAGPKVGASSDAA